MGKMADITMGVDSFFTESRLHACRNWDCKFNSHKQGSDNCHLKEIIIGSDGKCKYLGKLEKLILVNQVNQEKNMIERDIEKINQGVDLSDPERPLIEPQPPKEKEVTGGYFCPDADQEFRSELDTLAKLGKLIKRLDALENRVEELGKVYLKRLKSVEDNHYELTKYVGNLPNIPNKRLDALEKRLFGEVMPLEVDGMDVTELQGTNIINTLFDRVNQLSRKVDNFQHTDCKIMKSLKEKV